MSQIYYLRVQNIPDGLEGLLIDTNDSMNALQQDEFCGFRPFRPIHVEIKDASCFSNKETEFAFSSNHKR